MENPCCAAAAARMTKRLTLRNGVEVGVVNLDSILQEVAALKPADDETTRKELLQMVKDCNYVAPSVENEYAEALLREYRRRYAETDETKCC